MDIKSVVVIGAGTMGSGIAEWFASQFVSVELVDSNQEQLTKAITQIHRSWEKLVEKEKLTSCKMNQMKPFLEVKQLHQANKNADLVIEAIVENLEIKKNLFTDLDKYFSEKTILASNTSSFPITLLAQAVKEERKAEAPGIETTL